MGKSGSELRFEPGPDRTGPENRSAVQGQARTEPQVRFWVRRMPISTNPVRTGSDRTGPTISLTLMSPIHGFFIAKSPHNTRLGCKILDQLRSLIHPTYVSTYIRPRFLHAPTSNISLAFRLFKMPLKCLLHTSGTVWIPRPLGDFCHPISAINTGHLGEQQASTTLLPNLLCC
jgi:hypothetical protein